MAATDDELQKLGKPPIYSGKEDEWNEWSFVMRSYMSLLSVHVPALLASAEDATSPNMSMAKIRTTLTDDGVAAAQKTLPRLGVERERTSSGSDQRDHRYERSTGMTGVDHEIRTEYTAESTKSHERNPQCEALSLRAHGYEIALDEWQENIR